MNLYTTARGNPSTPCRRWNSSTRSTSFAMCQRYGAAASWAPRAAQEPCGHGGHRPPGHRPPGHRPPGGPPPATGAGRALTGRARSLWRPSRPATKEPCMLSDIEIATAARLRPITDVAQQTLGIDAEHLVPYGHHKAKVDLRYLSTHADRAPGRLILMTAISP